MAIKELICINCPRGCHLTVDDQLLTVKGNFCPRGAAYGKQEVTNPTRTVTSTVRISGAELPLCPVKTAQPIPKGKMSDIMVSINKITLTAPVHIGDVVIPNVCGTGIAVVATRNMEKIS
jgi:CxxC motif-containing protein